MTDQTEEKKEEGKRGEWEVVSIGFPIGWFMKTQVIPRFGGVLQESGDTTWRLSDSVKN